MKEEKDKDTEAKILRAATEIFQQKGFSGAKMQEIADKAEINRAMLHYYFRNKKNLFQGILQSGIKEMIPKINQLFEAELSIMEKMELLVENYLTFIEEKPHLPLFVLHELQQNPEKIADTFFKEGKPNVMLFAKQFQEEVMQGKIRPTDPRHLIVNIISLCVFPVIARPMVTKVLELEKEQYDKFIAERKKQIIDFVKNALKP